MTKLLHILLVLLVIYFKKFKWEVWEHLPYSLNLSPCNSHLFEPMKKELATEGNSTYEEIQSAALELVQESWTERFSTRNTKIRAMLRKMHPKFW